MFNNVYIADYDQLYTEFDQSQSGEFDQSQFAESNNITYVLFGIICRGGRGLSTDAS